MRIFKSSSRQGDGEDTENIEVKTHVAQPGRVSDGLHRELELQ